MDPIHLILAYIEDPTYPLQCESQETWKEPRDTDFTPKLSWEEAARHVAFLTKMPFPARPGEDGVVH